MNDDLQELCDEIDTFIEKVRRLQDALDIQLAEGAEMLGLW